MSQDESAGEQKPRKPSVLDKYTGGNRPSGDGPAGDGNDPPATDASTGNEPVRRGPLVTLPASNAAMLDVRFRDGRRQALPYSYLAKAEFAPSVGITCTFVSERVTITWRDLASVYAAISTHAALAICESDATFDEGGGVFVEAITIEPVAGD